MANYNVRVKDIEGDIHSYPEASKIEIVNDQILIEYLETESTTHMLDLTDEVIIRVNR